jgi:hypothetical protein
LPSAKGSFLVYSKEKFMQVGGAGSLGGARWPSKLDKPNTADFRGELKSIFDRTKRNLVPSGIEGVFKPGNPQLYATFNITPKGSQGPLA